MAAATVTADYPTSARTAKGPATEKQIEAFGELVSRQDVEAIVRRALGPAAKLVDYHVRIYSREKVGFMGAHQQLLVKFRQGDSSEDELRVFFLKGIPYEIAEQASVIEDSRAFYKEANFYKRIAPELTRSLGDESWLAQCYLASDSVLAFDDLKSRQFATRDKLLGLACIRSALGALGKMHAASLLAEKRLGKSLLELYPDVLEECLFVRQGKFNAWFESGTRAAVGIAKSMGLEHGRVAEACRRVFAALRASRKWRNVVCHGDPWSYNLMFDAAEPVPNCCFVDFQMVRYVPAMVDVAQMLYLTTRRAYREANEEDLLRYYHEVFCTTLREADEEISLPSLEETVQEYEDMRIVGLVTTALYFPVMLVEGNLSADLTKDSDGFMNLLFRDRVDLVLGIMQKDSMYRERIVESITELVQMANKSSE